MIFCKLCVVDGETGACCDFCKHFAHESPITGYGECAKHNKKHVSFGYSCDDFHCAQADKNPVLPPDTTGEGEGK